MRTARFKLRCPSLCRSGWLGRTSQCCFKLTHCLPRSSSKITFLQTGCTMLSGAFESFDYGPSVEVEGRKYTKAAPTTGQAMTTLGRLKFKRPRYRRTDRQGESFIPAEHQLGLTKGNLTPAAAGLSMALISSLPARESADFWKRFVGDGPSTGTLVRLSGAAGRCLEECSTDRS